MAATVKRIVPVTRNQGVAVPGLVQCGMWVDALVLVAATAQTYTFPTGASIFRISALAGDIWINFGVTAAAPGANNVAGNAPILLKTSAGAVFLAKPDSATTMSVLSTPGTTISIEAFS
jgi:hypothetical protein